MAEKTIANVASDARTLNTNIEARSTSVAPCDIHRHDSQIEFNNYYINYVDDSVAQLDLKTAEINEKIGSISRSLDEDNYYQIEISQLPEEIFMDENIQCEFECIFHEFDPEVKISYSKIFQRAYLTFSDPILAFQVHKTMNAKEFHKKKIQISYSLKNASSIHYLKPPKQERIYMQSPPTTPPIGWINKREELPDINLDLFLALSKLQPYEPLEILPTQNNHPSIVIHPCSDASDSDDDNNDAINGVIHPIIDKIKHKKYETIEVKRCNCSLHDTVFVPDEQYIKQSAGDGDKLAS